MCINGESFQNYLSGIFDENVTKKVEKNGKL